jgi:serine/threonine-protein kinase
MDAVAWSRLDGGILDGLFDADALGLDLGDRYQLGEVLGEGGQGVVLQAEDRSCHRQVAVKCAKRADNHIRAEAALLSRLAHPAIPQIYDVGCTAEGRDFMALQLVRGRRLDRWLEQDPPLAERLRVFIRIAEGIDHAHRRNVLHRDLKPTNLAVDDDGEAMILDWGLAAHNGKRSICGSPHFAAPEQLDGQPVDRRADVYALGVLLYWMLSGDLPYARRVSDFQEFRRVRGGLKLLPLRRRQPNAPRGIERLVQRCMATNPAARPASAGLVADLVRLEGDRLRGGAAVVRGWGIFLLGLLFGALGGGLLAWLTLATADTSPLDRVAPQPSMPDSETMDSDHARTRL